MNKETNKKSCCAGNTVQIKETTKSCCCSGSLTENTKEVNSPAFINGWIDTKIGKIPLVSTKLSREDKIGGLKVRMNFGRMKYMVNPGLYGIGNPGDNSIVFVTANYKLTFDTLRKELGGLDAWILVLDTKGINVWCAAGKGTFSTKELVKRIEETGLKEIVSHRKLIVPQLGATGISAHKVKESSGFTVIYGPVRAPDIPLFLEQGMKTLPEMRRVTFSFKERLQVLPVEFMQGLGKLMYICIAIFLLSGITRNGYALQGKAGLLAVLNVLLAYIAGTVLGPMLLPWLPGRSFSIKGFGAGVIVFIIAFITQTAGNTFLHYGAWFLLITAFSSFLTMNFTGASTYTSISGVKKEMRAAIPFQIAGVVVGMGLWVSSIFTR